MAIVEVVDYSMPYMKAREALQDAHEAMLEKRYEDALRHATTAIIESRLVYNSVLHEKEQHDKR